ncbi:hypothetical protein SDC9_160570 [bioreactor metagenome]|uniref:Uncharacterized protein n=1 Tax=bioreactor metagenome TaxID=1076179 RepID=A0A645FIS9_9ZZZZ
MYILILAFIPVYGGKKDDKWDIYLQSYLMPIDMLEEQLETDTYDVGTLVPGITVYGSWESDEKIYQRWNNDKGAEPFVIQRSFNGLAHDSIEIIEEFILLFNLYFNNQKNEYLDLANSETVVVKVQENGYVCVNKRYLKTYLSVKNMGLIIHMDSRCVNCENQHRFSEDGISYRNAENTVYYTLNIGNCSIGVKRENYSYIFGKKIILGCELKDCNIWPYNEEKTYIDFTIGIDDNGKEVQYNCNPKNLSNYFGANPSAPHYLTPVFFDAV